MTREEGKALELELQPDRSKCLACEQAFDRDHYAAQIYVGPFTTVAVCCSGRSRMRDVTTDNHVPKEGCALAARRKLNRCPGCGEAQYNQPVGTICEACGDKITKAEEAQARVGEARQLYVFRAGRVFGDLESRSYSSRNPLTDALCKALDPVHGSSWGHGGKRLLPEDAGSGYDGSGAVAELTEAQASALRTFLDLLPAMIKARIAEAEERGRSMLIDLASGKLSVDAFNDVEAGKSVNRR